jgi:hypothetical protein
LLIIVTAGQIAWDATANDFDWQRTTALPSVLKSRSTEELLYLDFRWMHSESDVESRNPRFRDAIASLAATLQGKPKDLLVGQDVHQHKILMRLTWLAAIALISLAIISTITGLVAVQERDVAMTRQLAAQAEQHLGDQLDAAMLLSVEANHMAYGNPAYMIEPRSSLLDSLQYSPHLTAFLHGNSTSIEKVVFNPAAMPWHRQLTTGRWSFGP